MDTINESIARAMESGRPRHFERPLVARDCMATKVITFHPEQTVKHVMGVLLKCNISGGPVVDDEMRLLGMISEIDCLRTLASGSYDHSDYETDRSVSEMMSRNIVSVSPEEEVFAMVELFARHSVRRLPVVEDGVVVGQVSRRDILRELSKRP